MSGISVDKTKLGNALRNFETLSGDISKQIETIQKALSIIEANWTGPEHTNSKTDYDTACDNMDQATKTLQSMEGAISQLVTNAQKIEYN